MKKVIHKGRIFTLCRKEEPLPNGRTAVLDIIEHPGAALIIPFITGRKVILLRQYRPAAGGFIHELPAGTLDKGETPRRCAAREIIEETGYAAGRLTRLGVVYPLPGYSTEKIFIYKGEGLKKREGRLDDDEVIETEVVTEKQVRELFSRGKLADAKTICAFAMCGWL